MDFTFPALEPLTSATEPHHAPDERLTVGFLSGAQVSERWKALTDTLQGTWLTEPPDLDRLFFKSPEAGAAYEALQKFKDETRCSGFLSAETGLPNFVFGQLHSNGPGDDDERVVAFLKDHELVFAGRSGGVQLARVRRTWWDDYTYQVTFQQTNSDGLPIRGASIVCTYDGYGFLSLIGSSLYPVRVDELPIVPPLGTFPLSGLTGAIARSVPAHVGFSGTVANGALADGIVHPWILPRPFYHGFDEIGQIVEGESRAWHYQSYRWNLGVPETGWVPDPARSRFHVAYQVPFLDKDYHHWAAWLGADQGLTLLKLDYLESHTQLRYEVFPENADAKANQAKQMLLDLGGSNRTLRTAMKVRLHGARLYDPRDEANGENSPGGGGDVRRYLGANTYYHAWETQSDFVGLMSIVREEVPSPPRFDNPLDRIDIYLDDDAGDADFKWTTGEIHLHSGDPIPPIVAEPAKDGEVVGHECAHAVMHFFYAPLLEHDTVAACRVTGRALDEALAFYFACYRFDNSQWGEFAYDSWGTSRNLDNAPDPYETMDFGSDPADSYYGYAMWWARVLWQLSKHPALTGNFNRILLKALRALAKLQPSLGADNGDLKEEIRLAFGQVASAIYTEATSANAQEAIRGIMTNAGLTVVG